MDQRRALLGVLAALIAMLGISLLVAESALAQDADASSSSNDGSNCDSQQGLVTANLGI